MFGFTDEELINFHNKISDNVKMYRKQQGLNQLDISIELGFNNSSFISHAENHRLKTHYYSIEHLYKISKILNIDICKLIS